jgi:hypothetical protein
MILFFYSNISIKRIIATTSTSSRERWEKSQQTNEKDFTRKTSHQNLKSSVAVTPPAGQQLSTPSAF